MVAISFPNLIPSFNFNKELKFFCDANKEKIKFPFFTQSVYGAIPYSYWNGNINSNWGEILLNPNYYDLNKMSFSPIRLDCSNILLNKFDLLDIHQNIILDALHNSGHLIEISDLQILIELQKKYPNFLYVISDNIDLFAPTNVEILNTLSEQDNIFLINISNDLLKNEDLLKNIKNKHKFEITIGKKCDFCDISKQLACKFQEQKYQYDFSELSVYNKCLYLNNYNNSSQIQQEIEHYSSLGFSHFKIDAPGITNIGKFQLFLINNLIKPEYVGEFLTILENKGDTIL